MKRICPSRSRGYSAGSGSLTLSTSSELAQTSLDGLRAVAPIASYWASGNELPSPAPRLDHHLVAVPDELARARGRQRDAVLVGLDLLGDTDLHGRADSSASRAARPAA